MTPRHSRSTSSDSAAKSGNPSAGLASVFAKLKFGQALHEQRNKFPFFVVLLRAGPVTPQLSEGNPS